MEQRSQTGVTRLARLHPNVHSCFLMEVNVTTERLVRIVAGFFVLASLALGVEASPVFVNQNFLWFTAFVSANLFQSGFTRLCPLETILRKLGVKSAGAACA
jgi:Protein of unknown function (DUF2892)